MKEIENKEKANKLFDLIWKTGKSGANVGKSISELGLLISGKETEEVDLPQPIMWPTPLGCLKEEYPYAERLIDNHRNVMLEVVKGALITAEVIASRVLSDHETPDVDLFNTIKTICKKSNVQAPAWKIVVDESGNSVIEVEKYYGFSVDVDIAANVFGLGKYYTSLSDNPTTAPAIAGIKAGSKAEALGYLDQVCDGNKDLADDLIKLNTHLRGIYFSIKYLLNGINFCCGMLSPEDGVVPREPEERAVHLMKIILVESYLKEDVSKAWDLLKEVLPDCKKSFSPGFVSEVFGLGFAVDYPNFSPEQYWKVLVWEGEKYFFPRILVKEIFNI
ncbi:hypothetical protein K8R32_01130 [bacterium]|nr:hypothetical protein [bacterium]